MRTSKYNIYYIDTSIVFGALRTSKFKNKHGFFFFYGVAFSLNFSCSRKIKSTVFFTQLLTFSKARKSKKKKNKISIKVITS